MIGILIFPDFQLLDAAGPISVFEIVARVPAGPGTWPAIWLIDESGNPYREIDVMEAVGVTPDTVFSTIHAGPTLAK